MKKEEITEFYEKILKDEKLKKKITEYYSKISSQKDIEKFLKNEIMPIVRSKNYRKRFIRL